MSRRGHVPIRMCVGCGERDAQSVLVRFAFDPEHGLVVSGRGGHCGRTGYLHARETCWERFCARKGLVRSVGGSFSRESRRSFVEVLKVRAVLRS